MGCEPRPKINTEHSKGKGRARFPHLGKFIPGLSSWKPSWAKGPPETPCRFVPNTPACTCRVAQSHTAESRFGRTHTHLLKPVLTTASLSCAGVLLMAAASAEASACHEQPPAKCRMQKGDQVCPQENSMTQSGPARCQCPKLGLQPTGLDDFVWSIASLRAKGPGACPPQGTDRRWSSA